MRKQLRSTSRAKTQVVTPGRRTAIHIKMRRTDFPRCGHCGVKSSSKRLSLVEVGSLPKSGRRPERAHPGFCPSCSREALKLKVRGGEMEMLVRGL